MFTQNAGAITITGHPTAHKLHIHLIAQLQHTITGHHTAHKLHIHLIAQAQHTHLLSHHTAQ